MSTANEKVILFHILTYFHFLSTNIDFICFFQWVDNSAVDLVEILLV